MTELGHAVDAAGPRGSSDASANTISEGSVLSFDFGRRRIGVAIGNTLVRVAHPLATIEEEGNAARLAAIAKLIDEWRPTRLVVGVPLHADGTEHQMTREAQRFARRLRGRFALPVVEVDERYTTQAAQSALEAEGRGDRRHRALRDQVAAQIILQDWFDERA
ncbi:MAG TPA: Holliday junction resolvase RuvX [Casimicrobiaceae bacterium]|nr:Holliday junction resolvase RuvX [Casimicrobiaceae bacterium]